MPWLADPRSMDYGGGKGSGKGSGKASLPKAGTARLADGVHGSPMVEPCRISWVNFIRESNVAMENP